MGDITISRAGLNDLNKLGSGKPLIDDNPDVAKRELERHIRALHLTSDSINLDPSAAHFAPV